MPTARLRSRIREAGMSAFQALQRVSTMASPSRSLWLGCRSRRQSQTRSIVFGLGG